MTTRLCSLLCLLAVALALLPGCATSGGASGRYVVTAPKSPFYKYGPAQAFGADFALNRGQKVTVVENSFGFSRVTTEDGLAGYMPTDDLAPAPPEPAPQIRATPRTASRRIRGDAGAADVGDTRPSKRRAPSAIEPGLPLFEVNDLPLPTDGEKPKAAAPKSN
jgi:hypothetical protein